MSNSEKHGDAFLSSSIFSLRSIRLAIAKCAIPANMSAHEIFKFFGINQVVEKQLHERMTEAINNIIAKKFSDVTPQALANLITLNEKLTDLQKDQLCAILTAPDSKTGYIG